MLMAKSGLSSIALSEICYGGFVKLIAIDPSSFAPVIVSFMKIGFDFNGTVKIS